MVIVEVMQSLCLLTYAQSGEALQCALSSGSVLIARLLLLCKLLIFKYYFYA
jgi:hypothetical protein